MTVLPRSLTYNLATLSLDESVLTFFCQLQCMVDNRSTRLEKMTDAVIPSTFQGMVKPVNCRKSRSSQNALERWTHLEKSSARIRERLIFNNRFENFHLDRHQEDLRSSEEETLRDIFRAKDHMKLSLIDLARSKRQNRFGVCDFERKIRKGENTPAFTSERDRLKKKERELRGLQDRLQGPNSQLLAEHVKDELKMIEYRNSIELNEFNASKTLPSIGKGVDKKPESLNAEENSHSVEELKSDNNINDRFDSKDTEILKSQSNTAQWLKLQQQPLGKELLQTTEIKKIDNKHGKVHFEIDSSKIEKITKKRKRRLIHNNSNSNSSAIMMRHSAASLKIKKELNQEPTIIPSNAGSGAQLSPVPEDEEREKQTSTMSNLHLQHLEESKSSAQTVVDEDEFRHPIDGPTTSVTGVGLTPEICTSVEITENLHTDQEDIPTTTLPSILPTEDIPRQSKTKRCRTKIRRQLLKEKEHLNHPLGVVSVADITSSSRRERHAQKRLAEVRLKTNKQVNKLTTSSNKRASNQLGMLEMPRSQKTKLEITAPKDDHDRILMIKKPGGCAGEIRLPPIRVDPHLLQELKRQRIKHRTESTKLPKLP